MFLTDKTLWTGKASSFYANAAFPGLSIQSAFDNHFSTNHNNGIFHSNSGDMKPWLQIQMEASFLVVLVEVYNRVDNYLPDFEYIQVSSRKKSVS